MPLGIEDRWTVAQQRRQSGNYQLGLGSRLDRMTDTGTKPPREPITAQDMNRDHHDRPRVVGGVAPSDQIPRLVNDSCSLKYRSRELQ